MYDPVREAAAQNAVAGTFSDQGSSIGGGPSQPEGDLNYSGNKNRITDTTRLGDYLTNKCADGNAMENVIDRAPNTTVTNPEKVFCSRI